MSFTCKMVRFRGDNFDSGKSEIMAGCWWLILVHRYNVQVKINALNLFSEIIFLYSHNTTSTIDE